MKKFERKPRGESTFGTRTGPRARAAQDRKFGDPYERAQRPARPRPEALDRAVGQRPGRPAVITLDPDVARVFRDSATVNDVLRTVMRLARFGGRSSFTRPRFGSERPATGERRREWNGPPGRRGPRFEEE